MCFLGQVFKNLFYDTDTKLCTYNTYTDKPTASKILPSYKDRDRGQTATHYTYPLYHCSQAGFVDTLAIRTAWEININRLKEAFMCLIIIKTLAPKLMSTV